MQWSSVVSFALGSVVSPLVLRAFRTQVGKTAKSTIVPIVTPIVRNAAKKVIGVGLQAKQFAQEAAAEYETPVADTTG